MDPNARSGEHICRLASCGGVIPFIGDFKTGVSCVTSISGDVSGAQVVLEAHAIDKFYEEHFGNCNRSSTLRLSMGWCRRVSENFWRARPTSLLCIDVCSFLG